MKYDELLAKYIKESGKTLDQIAEDCSRFGIKVHPTYISKLRLGNRKPPDYKVTVVLSQVLGIDPKELLAGSLVSETDFKDNELKEALRIVYPDIPNSEIHEMIYRIHTMRAKDIFEEIGIREDSGDFEFVSSTLTVPVLGSIPAGLPVPLHSAEYIEEWTEIPNMWKLKDGEVFILKVKGDSMIGSRIHDGDKVVVKVQPEVESGEIAVVNVNGDDATLKRVKKTDGQTILYPDNPKYDPIFINNENARIIGKVIQVMFEPSKNF
jgi:repressor LexA